MASLPRYSLPRETSQQAADRVLAEGREKRALLSCDARALAAAALAYSDALSRHSIYHPRAIDAELEMARAASVFYEHDALFDHIRDLESELPDKPVCGMWDHQRAYFEATR